jgi:hypothetical protein
MRISKAKNTNFILDKRQLGMIFIVFVITLGKTNLKAGNNVY